LRGTTKNSPFCVLGPFRELLCIGLGSMDNYKEYDSLYILERNDKKTRRLCVYGRCRELLPIVLGFRGDLQGRWHLVHVWAAWQKIHHFCI
jgi:hypothetical protein